MSDHKVATQAPPDTHREAAVELLMSAYPDDPSYLATAQVYATLAQADGIDRLTAVIERMEFPALDVSGSVLKNTCRIRPVQR